MTKFLIWMLISVSLTPLVGFFETYIFCDWQFIQFLAILIIGDTILGFVKAWKDHNMNSRGFSQILWKLFAYMSLLIVTHVLTNYKVRGDESIIFLWFDDMAYAAMVVRESISILENIAAIYPDSIPKWLIVRLKEFDLRGKFKSETK